ncbi:MAG: glutamate synthase central domain-containing protein [Merdibacter sp.]
MADEHPYGEWLDRSLIQLKDLPAQERKPYVFAPEHRDFLYRSFAYTYEDVRDQILPMARTVSNRRRPWARTSRWRCSLLSSAAVSLFQLFAQVTNPPIDSLREKIVTDTAVLPGRAGQSARGKRRRLPGADPQPDPDGRDMDSCARSCIRSSRPRRSRAV